MAGRTFYGPFSEKDKNYANSGHANIGRYPLGSRLVLPDERSYRFALNDGTVEVAGNLYQSVASVAHHINTTVDTARAAGDTVISATIGGTAAAIDIYAEGIVHVNDAAGEGYVHRIRRAPVAGDANAAAGTSAVLTVNLVGDESVQVALTTSSQVTFTRNRFHSVLIHPSPPTAVLAGVSPGVCAASRYYWSQVSGEAAVLADTATLAGLPLQASITVDGAVENVKRRIRTGSTGVASYTNGAILEDYVGAETSTVRISNAAVDATHDITGPILINAPIVGMCIQPNATTEYCLADLQYLGW